MSNLRANLKYHEDCGGWGCESVGYYILYEDVKEAAINFRKALILSNDDILLEYFDKEFGRFEDD